MCRHLAYLGPPVKLHDLVFAAPHSLAAQAHHPQHQDSGHTNPDGWGIGWYDDERDTPALHLTTTPIWKDDAFAEQARGIGTRTFVAAARLASPGATIAKTGNAPFRDGRWLFSLNGIVHGFAEAVGPKLRAQMSDHRRARLRGDADTEVLFALVLDRIEAGETPADALRAVIADVRAVADASLNLLLTDGHQVVATRSGRSLFLRTGITIGNAYGNTIGDAAIVVSEPLDDDPAWQAVPDESLITVTVGPDGPHSTLEDLA